MGAGRPSTYTTEAADSICEIIATTSKSMKAICQELELSVGTVLAWLSREKEFQEKYARAKEQQADFMAEEIIEIADDGSNDFMTIQKGDLTYEVENKEVVGRSRLRVDARKWVASKLKPKKYGDKMDITSGGEKLQPDLSKLTTDELRQMEKLLTKAHGNDDPDPS